MLWRDLSPSSSSSWLLRALDAVREEHDNQQIETFMEEIKQFREASRENKP